jgi:uncharacterized protein
MLDGFAPDIIAEIRRRLDSVRAQGIRIGFAIESGSRAWGFPSPDSDYDCRFVYVRPVKDHLSLQVARDVIEFPIVGLVDTGGWDLRKALLLALSGNAVIIEWLKSRLVYEEEAGFRARLSVLLDEIVEPQRVAKHYVGLLQKHAGDSQLELARLKKFLYALRPAIALTWMSSRDFKSLPPMNMVECMEGVALPDEVTRETLLLIDTKKRTREMGEGLPHPALRAFVAETHARFVHMDKQVLKTVPDADWRKEKANAFYRAEVLGGSS